MTEEEKVRKINPYGQVAILNATIIDLEKENAELKKEISVLLSCANCPENKGGYICEKEYNDKCLAQKIEYIKELKEENEDLRNFAGKLSENHANEWQEQQQVITELRGKLEKVSEWVKEQEYPDGCIDCSFSETEKLKEILENTEKK